MHVSSFHRRSVRVRRDDPEPRLAELLNDPVMLTLMNRDRVDRRSLETLIDSARRRLGLLTRAQYFEAALFAECRA